MALHAANLRLAEECLVRAADLGGLLLLYSSTGHAEGIDKLAELSRKKGKLNVSFLCSFLRGRPTECLELLLSAGRAPEAAFLARTYTPSQTSRMVGLWKEQLRAVNQKAADSIADPADYPNLFDGLELALKAEAWLGENQLHEACAETRPRSRRDRTFLPPLHHLPVPAQPTRMGAAPSSVAQRDPFCGRALP